MVINKHIFFFLFLLNFSGNAQEIENFEKLIVNDWSLKSFEINNQIYPPKERHENDRMIFYADKTTESISLDKVQKGIWSFNNKTKILNIRDINNNFDNQLKLVSISKLDCILEIENPTGTFIRLHMETTAR